MSISLLLYRVDLESVRFLMAIGDRDFYRGNLAVATFFATTVLPRLSADRIVVENLELDLMDLAEASF